MHVLGQAKHFGLPVQLLAIIDDIYVAAQRPQIPCGIMVQILLGRTCHYFLAMEAALVECKLSEGDDKCRKGAMHAKKEWLTVEVDSHTARRLPLT